MEDNNKLFLPPGFRFHPTDEEIITCYLAEKVGDESFSAIAMGEADLNKCEPWDLPSKAKYGEKEWYFFYQKERRYPTGTRTNRATKSGYWKATGKDKEIRERNGTLIGMKKTLVFYEGRAPKGEKTNWVMHEFRLEGDYPSYRNVPSARKNGWVVVKVFHKEEGHKTNPFVEQFTTMEDEGDENCTQNYQVNQSNSTSFLGQYCKVEQFSNSKASTSKDTDDVSSYDDGDPSSEPLFDWENIWNY